VEPSPPRHAPFWKPDADRKSGSRPHGLLVGAAAERLAELPLQQLLVTDTVAMPPALPLSVDVVSVAPLLAEVIGSLHADRPVCPSTAS
jgi:ribose-phosphate pyrophosphokinase